MATILTSFSREALSAFCAAGRATDWDATPETNTALYEREFGWTHVARRRWMTPEDMTVSVISAGRFLYSLRARHTAWSPDTDWDDPEVAARRAELIPVITEIVGVEGRPRRDKDDMVQDRWLLDGGRTSLWLREDSLEYVGPENTQADSKLIGE
ncbi:hypothetical protein [Propioniferax innocua]|uniref:Uncharacterized protein n=1 Tax=Propioniferax innocua TaxID=1753 RepID=A0A542ZR25_9ACTN|nr:hypothetical protein [Propioniferax innocua]TQL62736.1 hypothetical protein FB460_0525 [Propioniferax innocua]